MIQAAISQKKKHNLKYESFGLSLIGKRTYVMGVLNRTPDSFSDGGKFMDEKAALREIWKMADEGADIIDVGGESTRPGSEPVSIQEEIDRAIPIIEKVSKTLNIPISIDTSKHQVAMEAIRAGSCIVNDITGLKSDPEMAKVVSDYGAMVCVMHMKGTPKTMQNNPEYTDVIGEIIKSLSESVDIAFRAGILPDRIIVDPGIGFGKTVEHNLAIVRRLDELKVLGKPILIGLSRKSFIGKVLTKGVNERIIGTAAACAMAVANGANIIRVHDVKEMVDVAQMADAINGKRYEF